MPKQRRPRADAQRNRAALVAAATRVFAEIGADAPLDVIARRAGLGNATLYRHFPTRRDLIVAVYADEVTALCAYAEVLLDQEAPGDALFGWLRAFVDHVAAYRDLAHTVDDGVRSALFSRWHESMRNTAAELVDAAVTTGDAGPDLDAGDLLALATGIALTTSAGDTGVPRLLALIRHGATPAKTTRQLADTQR